MKAIASLGSTFFAFLAGAIVAAGTTVIIGIFLESSLPSFWWILLLSGFALTASSVFLLRLTVSLSSLETALAAIPLNMDLKERQQIIDNMTARLRKSAWMTVIASMVFVAMGVAALPARLALIKKDTPSIDHRTGRMSASQPDDRGVANTPSSLAGLDSPAASVSLFHPPTS
jgi:hypothetical protein